MANVSKSRKRLTITILAAFFFAAAFLLPYITANNPALNTALCPMHIPVMLCGFVCGPVWGAVVGFFVPLIRGLTVTTPPFPAVAVPMAFELAVYGLMTGLLRKIFPKKMIFMYLNLLISMVCGRFASAIAQYALIATGISKKAFVIADVTVNAVPAIIIQFAIIPPLVLLCEKLMKKYKLKQ